MLSRYSFTGHRGYARGPDTHTRPQPRLMGPPAPRADCASCAAKWEVCQGDTTTKAEHGSAAGQPPPGARLTAGCCCRRCLTGTPGTFLMAIMFTIIFLVDRVKAWCWAGPPNMGRLPPSAPATQPCLAGDWQPAEPLECKHGHDRAGIPDGTTWKARRQLDAGPACTSRWWQASTSGTAEAAANGQGAMHAESQAAALGAC